MITEIPGMLDALNLTLTHLLSMIEQGRPNMGTALTGSICEVEVNGKKWEIQLRVESDPKSFIDEKEVLASQTLNSIGGN